MIKKVAIGLPNKEIYIGRLQFYTNVNGTWRIFDYGKVINETTKYAEFDNLIVNSTRATYGTSERYSITNMIKWYSSYATDITSGNGGEITVTFKTPLKVLKSIYYHFYASPFTYIKVYDEYDNLIYQDLDTANKLVKASGYGQTSIVNDINYYETTGLETEKAFPINTIGSLETNDTSHYTNIYEINKCTVTGSVPTNTDMRFALSFDGRNTYKTYSNGTWVDINKTDIMTNGLTKDELEDLTATDYSTGLTSSNTLDFYIGMTTSDSSLSPIIKNISLNYLKIV